MSTFKGNNVQHLDSSVPNVVLDGDGNTTLRNLTASNINSDSIVVDNDVTVGGDTTIGTSKSNSLVVNALATGSNFNAGMTGEVRMYAGAGTAPTGWLYCNGDTIGLNTGTHKGSQYQNLFNLLSTGAYWGNTGNESWGSSTVKLPDFRGAFPLGVGQNQNDVKYTNDTLNAKGTDFTLSDTGGQEEHILSDGEVQYHTHSSTSNKSSTTDGSVAIFDNDDENFKVQLTVGVNGVSVTNGVNEDTSISVTTSSISTTNSGTGTADISVTDNEHSHSISPEYHDHYMFADEGIGYNDGSALSGSPNSRVAANGSLGNSQYVLRTSTKGASLGLTKSTLLEIGSSSAGISVSDGGHSHSISHTHGLSVPLSDININLSDVTVDLTQTNHSHSFAVTIPQGAFNSPHENMPPYLAINFIIKY